MGMSASQVRFLSLQNRKHDIGRRLSDLSNRKMSLSRDMNKVSRNYTEALNQKMLKWSNDSGASYIDLSYGLMMKPNELNTSIPYIVSTRDGRVVVDDKNDLMAGVVEKYNDGNGGELAKSFSSNAYVPAELQGKDITYENIAKWITSVGGGAITTADDGTVTGSATEVRIVTLGDGSVQKSSAYIIPDGPSSYKFTDTLRMQIFQEMGILSPQTMDKYNVLLTKLYGSEAAQDFGDYGQLLKAFDEDKNATINGSIKYQDIFGKLSCDPDSGNFDIDESRGCAMGNLALAQAYLKEYKAYLRTPLTHDIIKDNEYNIGSISNQLEGWDMLDDKTANRTFNFNYDDITGKGISNRMIEMFHISDSNDLVISDSGGVTYTSKGILTNLGFSVDNGDGTVTSYANLNDLMHYYKEGLDENVGKSMYFYDNTYDYHDSYGGQKTLRYDEDNYGNYDAELNNDQVTGITTWDKLFDWDGKWFEGASKTPDADNDGYFTGADYLDGSNTTTGMQMVGYIQMDHTGGEEQRKRVVAVSGFNKFVNLLADSFKSIQNVDEKAVDFAKEKVLQLYHVKKPEDVKLREHDDGSSSLGSAESRMTKKAKDIFGFAWCNHQGSDKDPVGFSTTNVIAAFITFYQMYAATEGNTSLIQGGSNTTVLNGDASDAAAAFDRSLAYRFKTALKSSTNSGVIDNNINLRVMQTSFDEWWSGRNYVNDNGEPKEATGQVHERLESGVYHSEYTIDGTTYMADVTKNQDGKITKIEYKIKTAAVSSPVTTSVINVRYYGANSEITESVYKVNYEILDGDDGKDGGAKLLGSEHIADIDYKYSTINMINGTPDNTGDDIVITLNSSSYKVEKIKNNSTHSEYSLSSSDNIPSDLKAYLKKGSFYYISSKTDKTVQDPDYEYFIDENSVAESVFASQITLYPEDKYSKKLQALVDKCQARVDELLKQVEEFFAGAEGKMMEYFDAIFKRISDEGWVADSKVSNSQYLNNKLQNNDYFITVCQTKGENEGFNYTNKMANMVTKVYEVNDDNSINVALSKYEADKALIQSKEKKVDAMMVKLETEQEAINTELQSIEKVRDQNIERTFKIFA